MKRLQIIVFLVISAGAVFGFPLPYEVIINDEEDIIRYSEEGFFEEYETEELIDMFRIKVELNTATYSELKDIPYMTSVWAKKIIAGRKEAPVTRIQDIISITGMSHRDFSLMSSFIKARWTAVVKSVTFLNADEDSGKLIQKFLLPGYKAGARIEGKKRPELISLGEWDEKTGEYYGIEVEDWYFMRETHKWSLISGKFRMNFNEGLGVSGGSIRSAEGIRPELTGADHFYGAAVSTKFGAFKTDIFYSDIKQDVYRYLLEDGLFVYEKVYNDARLKAAGGRLCMTNEKYSLYGGVYGSGKCRCDEVVLYSAACKAGFNGIEISAEIVSDGKDSAFQAGLNAGGRKNMIRSKFYMNQNRMELPLSDELRNNWRNYWEAGYSKRMETISLGATIRSYQGTYENKTLTYLFVQNNFGEYGRINFKYNKYDVNNHYYGIRYSAGEEPGTFWAEYTRYKSGYEKYSIGVKRSPGQFKIVFYLSYGGAYDWGSKIHVSAAWEPVRQFTLRSGYSYAENDDDPHSGEILMRLSI